MSEGPGPPSRRATILWPLALVAAVHLLTTPGQWLLTDQAEYIVVADHLVEHGSLHLSEPGEAPPPELPWVRAAHPGQPQRSRLLPLTSLTLAPFVLADRLLGSPLPPTDRPLVQLQGHVFVLAALALLGLALVDRGTSASAVALAVTLTGLAWPVWQASRRGGAEAVYVFLVALFLLGRVRAGLTPRARRAGQVMMAAACALLPWGNPTGAILGGALLAGSAAEEAFGDRAFAALIAPAAAWMVSCLALVALWNFGYHGSWWLGGYAPYYGEPRSVVDARALPHGIALHLRVIVMEAGPLVAVAIAGAVAATRRERAALLPAVAMVMAMLAVFASFPQPDPTRRLVAAWPAWGLVAGRAFGSLRLPLPARQAALAIAAVVGFNGFWAAEGRYHAGPGGLFYPSVAWVRLWIASAPAWQFALPCLILIAALVVATRRTSDLLAIDEPARG